MSTAHLPDPCDLPALLAAFTAAAIANPADSPHPAAVIHITGFIDPAAIAWLAAWGIEWTATGRRVHLRGDPNELRYLARMDLHLHLGVEPPPMDRRPDAGRLLPLRAVPDADAGFARVTELCDVIAHQFDDAAAFIPAVDWSVCEILDNISLHAAAPRGGVVCAQYFPKRSRLAIAIADVGRGIHASLAESHAISSDADALRIALQRGVTRDPAIGQGNGLAGTHTIAEHNGGDLSLWSGEAIYHLRAGRPAAWARTTRAPGTVLALELDPRHAVDLTTTWLGDRGSTYLELEALRLEATPIDIAAECLSTRARAHARPLRRKLEAVLTEMTEPLVLDFARVPRAASSFLDELLGRLAAHLGADAFRARIRVTGMNPLIAGLAETVIAQRLEGIEPA